MDSLYGASEPARRPGVKTERRQSLWNGVVEAETLQLNPSALEG